MPEWFGPAVIIVVLVVAIPVGVLISGAVAAGILGFFTQKAAADAYADTEYVELGSQG
ncbi:MAG: hypothetical protein R2699_07590 [Acidimicrobiales bacterium]|nr:hypothetical protein [Acidimicrobiales bacterium]